LNGPNGLSGGILSQTATMHTLMGKGRTIRWVHDDKCKAIIVIMIMIQFIMLTTTVSIMIMFYNFFLMN